MSDSGDDKSNTPRTDIIAGLWGGGDATIRRQLRRMEDHARQLENELSLAERRLATSEKCRNNLAASIPSSIGLTPKEGHCLLQVPQQTTEKPSPCAMAGYCLNTDAKAMPSAIERTPTYDPMAAFDQCDGGLPCIATTTGCAKGQCSRRKHAAAMSGVSVSVSYGAGEWFAAKVTGLDALGLGFVEATGRQFAFTFDRIDGYRGERPKEIGLKIGAIVHVLVNDGKVDRLSLKGRPASNDIGESRG